MGKKLQLFTDASISLKHDQYVGTIGGKIEDEDGKIIFVFFDEYKNLSDKPLKTSQIFSAETTAIFKGIQYCVDIAQEMEVDTILINSDNQMCIEYLQFYQMNKEEDCLDFKSRHAGRDTSSKVLEFTENTLYEGMSILKSIFTHIESRHLPREKNKFADYIATYAKSLFFNKKHEHIDYVTKLSKNIISDIIYDLTTEQSEHRKKIRLK